MREKFIALKEKLTSAKKDAKKDEVKEPLIFSADVDPEQFITRNGDFLIRESKGYSGLLSVSFMEEGVIKNKRFGLKDGVWEKGPGDDKGKEAQDKFYEGVQTKFDQKTITQKDLSSLGDFLKNDGFCQDHLVKPTNANASTNYVKFTTDSVYEQTPSPSEEKGFASLP